MDLTVDVKQCGSDVRVVTIGGALNNETCSVFEKSVEQVLLESFNRLIIDGSNLTYLSSSGLRLLFRLRKGMADRQGSVLMVKPPEAVYKVLRITNAFPEDKMHATLKDAQAAE